MDMSSRLDQFRDDNPYDVQTQAKRLLATGDKELILYALALGLVSAKSRQRHTERSYIDWIKRYVHFQQTRIGTAPDLEMRCSKAQHKCLVRNKICFINLRPPKRRIE